MGTLSRRLECEMTSALEPSRSSTGNDQRQIHVEMHVRIAHRAAVEQHGVVEQIAIAIGRRCAACRGNSANSSTW